VFQQKLQEHWRSALPKAISSFLPFKFPRLKGLFIAIHLLFLQELRGFPQIELAEVKEPSPEKKDGSYWQ